MKHLQVAGALIFENGKVFATKRGEHKYPYLAHKYEFPGGKMEEGELGEDTVRRELLEELDLEVRVERLFAITHFTYPDFSITLHLYECERLSDFCLKEHEDFSYSSVSYQ